MKIIRTLLLAATIGQFAGANAFDTDVEYEDVLKVVTPIRIESLAVGETGLISTYGLRTCNIDGELFIFTMTDLESNISEYSSYLEVKRLPNNEYDIAVSEKGKGDYLDTLQRLLPLSAPAESCEQVSVYYPVSFARVNEIEGKTNISSLISLLSTSEHTSVEAPEPEATDQTPEQLWEVIESKSEIDDSPKVTMIKKSEDGKHALVLRCQENTTEAYLSTDTFLSYEERSTTIRYDSEPAQEKNLSKSTNRKALFFSLAISNIKKMLESEKLVMRFFDYRDTPITTSILLDGISQEIDKLRTACNW